MVTCPCPEEIRAAKLDAIYREFIVKRYREVMQKPWIFNIPVSTKQILMNVAM